MCLRLRSIAGLILAAVLRWPSASAQESKPLPHGAGETLTYDVKWSVFDAGKVVATLESSKNDRGDDYEVTVTARSHGFASLLFNVQDEFHSFFDPETACSRRISKKVNEGSRHREMDIVFDRGRGIAVLDEREPANPNAPAKHAENAIPACVEDIVSAFYFVRQQPLRVGQRLRVPLNDGAKTHEIEVEVQAREQVKTGLGSLPAFRVEPKVFGEFYKRKGRMLVWYSDDGQRLPVRVKTTFSVGTITGTLRSVTSRRAIPPGGALP